jgi:hypothetical protein
MVNIRLFLIEGRVASDSVMADAEHVKKIPVENLANFLEWVVRFRTREEIYTDSQWERIRENFNLKSIEELIGAMRFIDLVFENGIETERSDLISDLKNLGFEQGKIELIINKLESAWDQFDDYLKRRRVEAIPDLTSLRWRIDIRYASSNYFRKPEVIALLRIGTSDRTERDEIYVELNKDKLSWLETIIGRIKREFLKAEEKLNQES